MTYNFSEIDNRIKDINGWLIKEFSSIRTGKASPSILDSIRVDSYGSKTPLNQVASISIEGPKGLLITPWDKDLTKKIESAILEADIGLSISSASSSVRVSFPDLTSERREQLMKITKNKLEEAKVSIRKEREKIISDIKKLPSEDEQTRHIQELEVKIKKSIEGLDELTKIKEKDLSL